MKRMQAETAKMGRLFRQAGHLGGTEERGPGKGVAMARRAVGWSGQVKP